MRRVDSVRIRRAGHGSDGLKRRQIMGTLTTDVKIIDVDTHYSEPADLWTARVPAKFHDLVPHQVGSEEKGFAWLVNGDEVLSARAGAGSVINKDGTKTALWDW